MPGGEPLGKVLSFGDNGAQPLADVQCADGRIVTIPFVPGIILALDEERKVVTIDPPEGLFFGEMAVASEEKTDKKTTSASKEKES